MLTKDRLDDGGIEAEAGLRGPAVFLDLWAVRNLTGAGFTELRNRFVKALVAADGSLLVSSVWVTELQTIQGDARLRVRALFSSLGAHWLLINPIVSAVAAREARNELGAYLSDVSLRAYVYERTGELQRSGVDPHNVSDTEFFDLGRILDWTAADPAAATQSRQLKDVAKARADADEAEERRDPNAHLRLYPPLDFASGAMACVHNTLWREVAKRSLGRTWMRNDGFDIAHLVPAMTIGGLIAADKHWKEIAEAASAGLPSGHVAFYRAGELESLVAALESYVSAMREQIARRAFEIFEERGRLHGHDLDDWLRAEHEIRGR
jgi:hypothetical protein